MVWARGIALIVAGLILAGCDGESPSPKPSATIPAAKPIPEAGQCLAREVPDLDDFAPDLESRVDCTEPHIYEVTAVIDVPARLVKGKTPKERVAQRNELAKLDDDDADRLAFSKYSGEQCGVAAARALGVSSLEIMGTSAEEARVNVWMRDASSWINVLDAGNWAKGNTKLLCTIRYNEHQTDGSDREELPDPESIRSQSSDPVLRSFLTQDFPLRHRQCVALKGSRELTPLSCDKQHQGEMIFSFDARPVLGTTFVESFGPGEPSKKQTRMLNQPCIDALPSFLGADYDEDLTAVAQRGGAGWVAQGDFYPTVCVVVARDSALDLPPGSLVGGAKQVDLVPAGQSQVSWLRSR